MDDPSPPYSARSIEQSNPVASKNDAYPEVTGPQCCCGCMNKRHGIMLASGIFMISDIIAIAIFASDINNPHMSANSIMTEFYSSLALSFGLGLIPVLVAFCLNLIGFFGAFYRNRIAIMIFLVSMGIHVAGYIYDLVLLSDISNLIAVLPILGFIVVLEVAFLIFAIYTALLTFTFFKMLSPINVMYTARTAPYDLKEFPKQSLDASSSTKQEDVKFGNPVNV